MWQKALRGDRPREDITIKATPHPPDSSTHACSMHGTSLLTSPGEAESLYSNIILSPDETCPPLFACFFAASAGYFISPGTKRLSPLLQLHLATSPRQSHPAHAEWMYPTAACSVQSFCCIQLEHQEAT